jgi:hypothetical protein
MMEIEIKMTGGAAYTGDSPKDKLEEIARRLSNSSEFIVFDTLNGPVILNKANILSVRKK